MKMRCRSSSRTDGPARSSSNLKIIDPLTNPTAHGGSVSDAFHVVIPSMPGYGFSAKPTTRLGPRAHGACLGRADEAPWIHAIRGARRRLGRDCHGRDGDAGTSRIDRHSLQHAWRCATRLSKAIATGGPAPAGLSGEERAQFEKLKDLFAKGVYYAYEMATRPQTLYGIADSPAGLAAWLIDLGDGDAKPAAALSAALRTPTKGQPRDQLTRDDVLDNITLFWLTNTGISSARLYWENKFPFFDFKNVTIPVAVSVFPGEFFQTPRSWAERAYPKLIHYNKVVKGGHFPAWEQPTLFSEELRVGFRSLRA